MYCLLYIHIKLYTIYIYDSLIMDRKRLLDISNSLSSIKIYDLVSKFLSFVENNSNLNKEIKDQIPSLKEVLSSF